MSNPYFEPGPDGRRPIVERVEACRPDHCEGCPMRLHPWQNPRDAEHRGYWWTAFPENAPLFLDAPAANGASVAERDGALFVAPNIALALCRCAVEDWLAANTTEVSLHTGHHQKPVSILPAKPWTESQYPTTCWGGTIHEALNAAAHAVADAMGVER